MKTRMEELNYLKGMIQEAKGLLKKSDDWLLTDDLYSAEFKVGYLSQEIETARRDLTRIEVYIDTALVEKPSISVDIKL